MRISVVIPVFNVERYVRTSLDSVLAQTFSDWECVCVDDGSTDGSGAILDEYAARDPRFRVIHQANAGVSAARNRGMDAATGDQIVFLDADDTYDPRALEILADVWRKTGADVIRYGCSIVENHADDKSVSVFPPYAEVDLDGLSESPLRRCSLGWASAISAQLVSHVRWPSLTHCEDPLFILRCMKAAGKVVFIDGNLANYLLRPCSAVRTVSLSIVTATCRYLVMAYDECAGMPGFQKSRADTCAFLSGFLTGPLAKCGRDVPREHRKAAEAAVRTARNLLAARDPAFASFACREAYDFAFVLGSSCTATDVLRQAGLQYESFPLDWVGRLGARARTDMIVREFDDFLALDRLTTEPGDDGMHRRCVDGRDGTAFFHDFKVDEEIEKAFPAVSEKYARRAARFLGYMRRARSVLVVWIGDFRDDRDGVSSTDADMRYCLDRLSAKYPDAHFSMLAIDLPKAGRRAGESFVCDGRIRRIWLDYRNHEAGPESWLIRVDALLPYFSQCSVADYRSPEAKRAYRAARRRKRRAMLNARTWWEAFVTDIQYRTFRKLQKVLLRKGVRLS